MGTRDALMPFDLVLAERRFTKVPTRRGQSSLYRLNYVSRFWERRLLKHQYLSRVFLYSRNGWHRSYAPCKCAIPHIMPSLSSKVFRKLPILLIVKSTAVSLPGYLGAASDVRSNTAGR